MGLLFFVSGKKKPLFKGLSCVTITLLTTATNAVDFRIHWLSSI